MSNPMFNGSGCKDPTAYEAIKEVDNEKKQEIEQVKKLLFAYNFICRSISELQDEVYRLGNLIKAERDTSKALTYHLDESQKTNKITDPTALAVTKIIDNYDKQVKYSSEKIELLFKDKDTIDHFIEEMTEDERHIFELRYVKRMRWWQVAKYCHYSESHCKMLNDRMLNKLNKNKDNTK